MDHLNSPWSVLFIKVVPTLVDHLFIEPVCHERVICPSVWFTPEPAFIFKQDLELPSRLPFKYFSVPMLLNFSAKKGTGVSNGPL